MGRHSRREDRPPDKVQSASPAAWSAAEDATVKSDDNNGSPGRDHHGNHDPKCCRQGPVGNVAFVAGRFIGGVGFEAGRWWVKDWFGLH